MWSTISTQNFSWYHKHRTHKKKKKNEFLTPYATMTSTISHEQHTSIYNGMRYIISQSQVSVKYVYSRHAPHFTIMLPHNSSIPFKHL
jgi:hypothetical protein